MLVERIIVYTVIIKKHKICIGGVKPLKVLCLIWFHQLENTKTPHKKSLRRLFFRS